MSARRPLAACALLALISLVAAVLLQHGLGMQPCAWCVLQRLFVLALLFVILPGALAGAGRVAQVAAAAGGVLAAGGLGAALHQQFVAARSDACGLSLADRIIMAGRLHEIAPWLFMPTARCDEANAPLLGIPFALWSAGLFVVSMLLCAVAFVAARRAARGSPR
jgi:disulfide bond formation protein DsbB